MSYEYHSFRSFSETDFDAFKREIFSTIEKEINSNSDDYILNVNEDEYITYLAEKYRIDPLNIDIASEEVGTPKEIREDLSRDIYAQSRWGRYRDGYSIPVSYRFSGDARLFHVRPNPFTLTEYEIWCDVLNQRVCFNVVLFSQKPEEFVKEKESIYRRAFANVDNINSCVKAYNDTLYVTLKNAFTKGKKELIDKTNFFTAIKVKRTSSPTTYDVPKVKKIETVKPILSKNRSYYLEPTIDTNTYNEIVGDIYQIGISMEKKPSLYLNKDEESLRDVFLLGLETRYEGTTATGETFNHTGKTDILLKNSTDSSNLFIAECKIWHGKKHLQSAISQLLSYLTWRDSKAALILFVKGTDFTTVLQSINEGVTTHDCFLKYNKSNKESSINYSFHLPQDNNKEVFIEVMAFNFDKG
jgi:hypothetical protein